MKGCLAKLSRADQRRHGWHWRSAAVAPPHQVDGRKLADGGILDPLPMAPVAAVNSDLTIAVSLSGSEAIDNRDAEPCVTVEWLNRMVRSTSALLDIAAARSLLDRPTARTVLSRFGADNWSEERTGSCLRVMRRTSTTHPEFRNSAALR
jgi:predicted acylesterase/phospholipase RssA